MRLDKTAYQRADSHIGTNKGEKGKSLFWMGSQMQRRKRLCSHLCWGKERICRCCPSQISQGCKNLPKRFTFTDVQKILRSIPEIKADTASTESLNEDYIYFELCYILKEQSGSHLSFYRIREFASSTDMSTFINFEGVFISLYQLVKLYNQTNPSERLNHFADKLKEAASALFNHDFKNSPLAKDFLKMRQRFSIHLTLHTPRFLTFWCILLKILM